MRVRIAKELPAQLEGFNLTRYERDRAYDIAGSLGDLLVAYGYAVPDDLAPDRSDVLRALAGAAVAGSVSTDEVRQQVKPDVAVGPVRPARRRARRIGRHR
jgi:hypothetical protein